MINERITSGMLVGTLFTLFVLPTFYLPFGKAAPVEQSGPRAAAAVPVDHPATEVRGA